MNKKRRFGDRYDGRRIKTLNPYITILPYIMKNRNDAQVFFEQTIDITKIEDFIRKKRSEGLKTGILQVIIAAYVRAVSQKPALNRFVAGRKIYARNKIEVSMAVKKQMLESAEDTTIKVLFDKSDTIFDVCNKLNSEIEKNKGDDKKNNTDKTAKIFTSVPGFLIMGLVKLLEIMDFYGIMPKIIHKVSPFHTSMFITDLGSIGIEPVYHHIYNFGTTPLFIAFGTKQKTHYHDDTGEEKYKKTLNLKIVLDERTNDGFFNAMAVKYLLNIFKNPEILEKPPEQIYDDIE